MRDRARILWLKARGGVSVATEQYDAIVIGAGQGGGPLSTALAEAGRTTALIEREHVGGTCVNTGCTPSKTMIASARVAYLAQRGQDYGVHTGPVSVDMVTVRGRKRDMVESFRSGSQGRIESTEGLDLLKGEASFAGPKTLRVRLADGGQQNLTAETLFINTGTRPGMPPVEGLEGVSPLTSTTIMELGAVPEHLLVLGGGYIGLEFAQMFRRFGSQVTVMQRPSQLMVGEDADIAEEIAKLLREDGVQVMLKTEARRARRIAEEEIELTVHTQDGEQRLTGSHVLVAGGRKPNTEGLNLGAAGVEIDEKGFVRTNERLETNVQGIYAIGDVRGGPQFTHISYDDYRILRANLLDGGHRTADDRLVPYTVFLDPELGRVGLSEEQARKQGCNVRVAKMPMSRVARALEADEPRGFIKAVVDAETDRILGCAALGVAGGEIMSMLEIAMMGNVPYTALRDGVFAHPTLAECLNNLFASFVGEQ